jgi:hypothetical protein
VRSLEERIARYFSPPLFPVQLSDVPAQMTFHDVPDEWEIGSARLVAQPISHPGPTVGYCLSEENGRSLAYLPDHEPGLGADLTALPAEWVSGHALADAVDVLVHDAQYTEDEYAMRVGWGHSSVEQAVTFARKASVRQLVLYRGTRGSAIRVRADDKPSRTGDAARDKEDRDGSALDNRELRRRRQRCCARRLHPREMAGRWKALAALGRYEA